MKMNICWLLCLLSFLGASANVSSQEKEAWICDLMEKGKSEVAFSFEYAVHSGEKLLGPIDEYSGRRHELMIVMNNAIGIVAVRPSFNAIQGTRASSKMFLTTVSIQKKTGILKMISFEVGSNHEEIFHGVCKKNEGLESSSKSK